MTQTFPIVPANLKWLLLVLVPAGILCLGALVLLVTTLLGSQRARFEVTSEGLRIRGDLYGRTIPHSKLLRDRVRVVNLDTEAALVPSSRRMGTGLPGYRAGWFRLSNGERSLVYVTDWQRVVYVPTTEGYSVLLSTPDPAALSHALRSSAVSVPRG